MSVLEKTVTDADIQKELPALPLPDDIKKNITALLTRETGLAETLIVFAESYRPTNINYIAVTQGPGLEPALWVGINAARALSIAWNIPLIPVNHMEGHVISPLMSLVPSDATAPTVAFPALALIASGGHTELLTVNAWGSYTLLGETRDDAVGESFDKVARMLNLPYPGGPEISKLAAQHRATFPTWSTADSDFIAFPRPMLHSPDYHFSFSGIKTSVLYYLRDLPEANRTTPVMQQKVARAFEDAVVEVLVSKTMRAADALSARSIIVGGGVIANSFLREQLTAACAERGITLHLPTHTLATDNATMIGMAAFLHTETALLASSTETITAQGRMPLGRDIIRK